MSTGMAVSAKVPASKEKGTPELGPVSIMVQTGATAKEMIEMFGDEAVKTNAQANWTVTLQGNIRSGLRKGESQEQVQARLGVAKMGVSTKGATVDPTQAYQAQFLAATPADQVKMIKGLQKRAQELQGK